MIRLDKEGTQPHEFSYHLLRNALNDFGKNLGQLLPQEYASVVEKARKSYELESLVIASSEAEGVVISDQQLDRSVQQVASRYESAEEFRRDLEINGLDRAGLRHALYRELLFDSILQRVAAQSPEVTEVDSRLFYEMHRDRFSIPEQRAVRHILITINPDYPENTRAAALSRMEQLVARLAGRGNRFSSFAERYSECPTAMDGGKLGEVSRGQLYPELDTALFNLQEGEISDIVETELGMHVLWCEKIQPAKQIPFSKARARIRATLEQRNRRLSQKTWLAGLLNQLDR